MWRDYGAGLRHGKGPEAGFTVDIQGSDAKAPTPRRTSGVQSRAAAGSSDGLSAKEWIAQRESGGDYNAVSPSGKYIGRYQLSKDKLNGDYSPENQEKVAESYVKSRYGSWENAKAHWEKYGWY